MLIIIWLDILDAFCFVIKIILIWLAYKETVLMNDDCSNDMNVSSGKMILSKGLVNLLFFLFWGSGAIIFISGFFYWHDILGPLGYLVALTYVADFILSIIRIVNHGFSDWYVILAIIHIILMWIVGFLKTRRN